LADELRTRQGEAHALCLFVTAQNPCRRAQDPRRLTQRKRAADRHRRALAGTFRIHYLERSRRNQCHDANAAEAEVITSHR
jgi:hypothetical protein